MFREVPQVLGKVVRRELGLSFVLLGVGLRVGAHGGPLAKCETPLGDIPGAFFVEDARNLRLCPPGAPTLGLSTGAREYHLPSVRPHRVTALESYPCAGRQEPWLVLLERLCFSNKFLGTLKGVSLTIKGLRT